MRKYRFKYTNSKWAQIRPKLNTLYFFCAWNFAGYAIYKFVKAKATKNIEGFDELSTAEQNMHLMGARPTQKVTIRGFQFEKIEPHKPFEPKPKAEPT